MAGSRARTPWAATSSAPSAGNVAAIKKQKDMELQRAKDKDAELRQAAGIGATGGQATMNSRRRSTILTRPQANNGFPNTFQTLQQKIRKTLLGQ